MGSLPYSSSMFKIRVLRGVDNAGVARYNLLTRTFDNFDSM